jgi:tight adherence protein B
MEYVFIGLAFLAGFLLIFGVNLLIADLLETQREQARKRMEEDLRVRQKERSRSSVAYKELYEAAAQRLAEVEVRPNLWERFVMLVDESGLTIHSRQLAAISGALALATLVLSLVLDAPWAVPAVAVPVMAALPVACVAILRSRRREKLLSQLPDAYDLMGRTLRAGQTLPQALQAVADEFSSPIAEEFGYCYDQQNLGLSLEAAMRELARRMGILELKIFVLAVTIHRQTGGNLAELLGKLSHIIRQRFRIRGHIRALTAEGRLQAVILLALPLFMLGLLLVLNPSYVIVLFHYPKLLGGMALSMTVGAYWIYRIVHFDF